MATQFTIPEQFEICEATQDLRQQAAEAAKQLAGRERLQLYKSDGSDRSAEIYRLDWTPAFESLISQVLKDHANVLKEAGRGPDLVVQKRVLELSKGSLYTPKNKKTEIRTYKIGGNTYRSPKQPH
ncbi:hypothetical protein diail_4592 [Diaporthe ilicicola]|nr:hypothetical protein diail_4592 [Diaporthe ilicicola]